MDDLISRKALLEKKQSVGICDPYGNFYGGGDVVFTDDIESAAAVDAVEVVRCANCKFLHNGHDDYCCRLHTGLVKITPYSFCSYGERKENETD